MSSMEATSRLNGLCSSATSSFSVVLNSGGSSELAEVGVVRYPEAQRVRRRRERNLGVTRILARQLGPIFVGDQLVVIGRLKATRDRDVDLGEVREVAVGEPPA